MKSSLIDLNNHLFAQIERLGDEGLEPEQIETEIERAKAIAGVADRIINNAGLVLKARQLAQENVLGAGKTDHLLGLEDKSGG